MASAVRCFNLVLGYKSNRYKEYKWILAFLKLKRLIKKRGEKDKGKRGKIRLSVKRGQLA